MKFKIIQIISIENRDFNRNAIIDLKSNNFEWVLET